MLPLRALRGAGRSRLRCCYALLLVSVFPVLASAQELMTYTFAGRTGATGTVDGLGTDARFDYPAGVAADAAGNLYVVDTNASAVRKVSPAGLVTLLAGSPGNPGSNDGVGNAARFLFPEAIAVDPLGNVFVSDSGNATIRRISAAGVVTTFAGAAGQRGSVEGPGATARFQHPRGLGLDSQGNLYVADAGNYTIRKITPAGVVSTFAGLARQNGSGSPTFDGTGSAARFASPFGIAVDASGNVFVSDAGWKQIRRITPAGVVTTIAGSVALGGTVQNGTGLSAGFRDPGGLALDQAGNLYVLETSAHVVRRVTPAGVVTTPMGLFGIAGAADGPDSVVRFNLPSGIASDAAGTLYIADAGNATLRKRTPVFPPTFASQPSSQPADIGQGIFFAPRVNSTPAATFQWRKNGVDLPGATQLALTLTNVSPADAGSYQVIATNLAGSTASAVAVLTVIPPPVITVQPANQALTDGQPLVLQATVTSASRLSYRWQRDGVDIPGATNATYNVSGVAPRDAGNYTAIISNPSGAVTTTAALVTVQWSRFVNLSVRTRAGASDAALIVGFVVAGETKPLLVRGTGPALTQFGVTGALADPQLVVYRGGTVVANNDDWGTGQDAAQLASTAVRVGAFALPAASRDAALQRTLSGGAYTAHVFSAGTVAGTALTELYDADSLAAGRLVNLSARARVEGGDNILIAGFVVAGNTRKRVLVRGVGPGLSAFGVTGVLANPRLAVFQNGVIPVATNDDWNADIAPSAAAVGAFPLTVGSRDAAIILLLDPASYTVQVTGVGDTSGNALVEIYELP